jgi:hypothetical protein
LTNRYEPGPVKLAPPTAETIARAVAVFPAGRVLPRAFLDAAIWGLPGASLPVCLQSDAMKCSAVFMTLRPGEPEALVFFADLGTSAFLVFEQDQAGRWRNTGQANGPVNCTGVRQAFEHGDVGMKPHPWPDLAIGGRALVIAPLPDHCDGTP